MDSSLGYFVYKPNFHRLVELVHKTILTVGHVRVISEIPFETNNHTLKQSMARKPHTDKRITLIYHIICTDFQRRIIQQLDIISMSREDMKFNKKRILAVLLLGNVAIHLCSDMDEESRIVEQVFSQVFRLLKKPPRFQLSQHKTPLSVESTTKYWIVGPPYINKPSVHVKKCIHILHQISLNYDHADIIQLKKQLLQQLQLIPVQDRLMPTTEYHTSSCYRFFLIVLIPITLL